MIAFLAQVLYRILKPGGFVFNVGPLLYHWAQTDESGTSDESEPSLELSLADVRAVATAIGFEFVEESEAQTMYMGDTRGLFQMTYTSVRWVMRKPTAQREPEGASRSEDCGSSVNCHWT
jgi:carnosine N-methyltransferase